MKLAINPTEVRRVLSVLRERKARIAERIDSLKWMQRAKAKGRIEAYDVAIRQLEKVV